MNELIKNGAVIMPSPDNKGYSVYFPVPAQAPEKKLPAFLQSITLLVSDSGERTLRLAIRRDLSVPIRSFTFRFRFSHLPVYIPDASHSFSDYVYTEEDLNSTELITFNASIPDSVQASGCGAYISAVVLESGQVLEYDAKEYRFVRRPRNQSDKKASAPATTNKAAEKTAAIPSIPSSAPDASEQKKISEPLSGKKKRTRLTVILATLLLVLIVEAIGGASLYRYLGVKNSTDALMKEFRYNEAYKIAMDSDYESLLQRVCEKAAVHYFESGDLESAYVYAYGAPERFTDMIIEYAAQSVVSMITGDINENAFRVAKMSEDDHIFDVIIHSMIDILESRGDYSNALLVASELRSADDRSGTERTVFVDAIDYYSKNHRYSEAYSFIRGLDNITTFKMTEEESLDYAIKRFAELGDHAGIIYFAHHYPGIDTSSLKDMKVVPEDGGVRAELAIVYPVLTEQQRRIYHSNRMAIWNDKLLEIEDGKLTVGTVKLTNAVSVDTNENATIVLHTDGSVTLVPNPKRKTNISIPAVSGVVDIALGGEHAVLLHNDGTVTAYGDNTFGQLNVGGWTDIAAIAAGQHFTIGLKTNGSVVSTGDNKALQCDVKGCNNVVDIAACNQTSVLLFSDGTIKLLGYRSMGLAMAETVSDVTRMRAGGTAILCELKNGEYRLYSGNVSGDYGNPYNWRNMEIFDVGVMCIAGKDTTGALFGDGDGYTG